MQNPEQPGRVEQPDPVRAEQRLRDAAVEDAQAVGQQPHAVGGGAQRSRTVPQKSQPEGLPPQDSSDCTEARDQKQNIFLKLKTYKLVSNNFANPWRLVAKLVRWVAKLVARLLATAALWVPQSRHLSKMQKGRHKQRSDQNTVHSCKVIYD